MTTVWPVAGGRFYCGRGSAGANVQNASRVQKRRCEGLLMCWWEEVGRSGRTQGTVLVRVSSCVHQATFAMFLTFCHYCHFTWEAGRQRERALTADWPQMLFIWLISLQTTIPSLNCGGAYTGRRWEGASTGEMSHQGSQRGVKLRLTSAGSVAPLCPLCAPGKMI